MRGLRNAVRGWLDDRQTRRERLTAKRVEFLELYGGGPVIVSRAEAAGSTPAADAWLRRIVG